MGSCKDGMTLQIVLNWGEEAMTLFSLIDHS